MSFNAEDIREELLDLLEGKRERPHMFPLYFSGEAELTRLLDGVEFLLLSPNVDWVDTASLFVSEFSVQIAKAELGRERLAEWLPLIGQSQHYNSYDDVAQVCDVLIPSGPK